MPNISLEDSLKQLAIDSKIIQKLNNNHIIKIKDLWQLKRKNLKELGLTDTEIKHITIKLQLHSIDLNKKIYTKS
ncbi:MAG: hypothetical protein MR598_04550 [Erysipelotrichaceae bacterium]|nr:hypothetical protein [Erysipelotrichaceae bacterium]